LTGIGSEVGLYFRAKVIGAEATAANLNKIASAVGNVNQQLTNQGRAMTGMGTAAGTAGTAVSNTMNVAARSTTSLGRSATAAGTSVTGAMNGAAQSAFRYTFYAMMALRVGQMLISKVLSKGMITAGASYERAWTRINAVLQTTTANIGLLQEKADHIAMTLPFGPIDAAEAMRTMAKAGMQVNEIVDSIAYSANMAAMGEISLSDAATMTVTTLRAYGKEATYAAHATDLIGYYASKSIYDIADLGTVLNTIGPTAHAYGQDLAQTLQLASAFGGVGVSASEAGTLMRQLYMRASKPEVRGALEWGLAAEGEAALYSPETGSMTNVGSAYMALARQLSAYKHEAGISGAEKADRGAAIDEAIYQLFGVRQARGFLSLSTYDENQFNSLIIENLATTEKAAEEYRKKYIDVLSDSYYWTEQQLASTKQLFATTMGAPMLRVLRPFKQAATEVVSFVNNLIKANETTEVMIPNLILAGTMVLGLSGAVAIAAGTFMLLKTRMADVGRTILANTAAVMKLNAAGFATAGMSESAVGLAYFRSFARVPMRFIGGAALVGGLVAIAWRNNLWDLQEHTSKFLTWWRVNMRQTGGVAKALSDKLLGATEKGTGTGSFLEGFVKQFQRGGTLDVVGEVMFKFLVSAGKMVYTVLSKVFWIAGKLMHGFAWMVGFGDTAKGLERVGAAIGFLLSITILEKTAHSLWTVGKGLFVVIRWISGLRKAVDGWSFGGMGAINRLIPFRQQRASAYSFMMNPRRMAAAAVGDPRLRGITTNAQIASAIALNTRHSAVVRAATQGTAYNLVARDAATAAAVRSTQETVKSTMWRNQMGGLYLAPRARYAAFRTGGDLPGSGLAAHGGIGMGRAGSMLATVMPYILTAAAIVGIIALIAHMFRKKEEVGPGYGPTNDFSNHFTIVAAPGESPEHTGRTVLKMIEASDRNAAEMAKEYAVRKSTSALPATA